jgi:hypothetical protein
MGAAAGSELLISEPKTRVRSEAAASAHRAHLLLLWIYTAKIDYR